LFISRESSGGRDSGPNAGTASTYHPIPNAITASAEDGLTTAIAAVAAENRLREQQDYLNVKMLGYDSWWDSTDGDKRGTAFEYDRKDLLDEIEDHRYFVVLMAYDFQLLWKEKKHKLLWETRFSISERNNQFDKALPLMAAYASQYFGRASDGLLRTRVPAGRVDIGEVKSLGEVPETNNPVTVQPAAKPQ